MRKLFISIFATIPLLAHGQQIAGAIDGDYIGSVDGGNASLRTIVLDAEKGVVAASVSVWSNSCSGEVTGIGRINKNVLSIQPYTKDSNDNCVITVTFDKTGKKAKMNDRDCMGYHGASCSFDGALSKKK